jgi:hypothetical protein
LGICSVLPRWCHSSWHDLSLCLFFLSPCAWLLSPVVLICWCCALVRRLWQGVNYRSSCVCIHLGDLLAGVPLIVQCIGQFLNLDGVSLCVQLLGFLFSVLWILSSLVLRFCAFCDLWGSGLE